MKVYIVMDMSTSEEVKVPVWTACFDSSDAAKSAISEDIIDRATAAGIEKEELAKILVAFFANGSHVLAMCEYDSSMYSITEADFVLSHEKVEEKRSLILMLKGVH